MHAAMMNHKDVAERIVRMRVGTAHTVDWKSYEGIVTEQYFLKNGIMESPFAADYSSHRDYHHNSFSKQR